MYQHNYTKWFILHYQINIGDVKIGFGVQIGELFLEEEKKISGYWGFGIFTLISALSLVLWIRRKFK